MKTDTTTGKKGKTYEFDGINCYSNLPPDLAGFQHIENGLLKKGDLAAVFGEPLYWINELAGQSVREREAISSGRFYRRIPAPSHTPKDKDMTTQGSNAPKLEEQNTASEGGEYRMLAAGEALYPGDEWATRTGNFWRPVLPSFEEKALDPIKSGILYRRKLVGDNDND